jgi:very-short-patch-repair endonuclease
MALYITILRLIELDKKRQAQLEQWKYIIIRFTNEEVLRMPEEVLSSITKKWPN